MSAGACDVGRVSMAARPKSVMRTWPAPSIMMLAGLRSRCSTPRSCGGDNGAELVRELRACSGSRPMRRSSGQVLANHLPIVMNGRPSVSPMSYIRQTFLWEICRARRTSLWKPREAHGIGLDRADRNFSATGWPSLRSSAR